MKNLKHAFVLSLLTFCHFSFGQTAVEPNHKVQYGENTNLHARGLTSSKNEIHIAASDGQMYAYTSKNEKCTASQSIGKIQYRDIISTRKNILLLASGDSSKTLALNRKTDETKITSFDSQFLDGISLGKKTIFMMGDPIDEKFNLMFSKDFGWTWQKVQNAPKALEGEAGFAASGTNVRMLSDRHWLFVSGGNASRLFQTTDAGLTWTAFSMGFESCESCGAYSFAILPNKSIVAVGGDYTKPDSGKGACRISHDGGLTWAYPKVDLNGYRSNVIFNKGVLFACGTNGIDISFDEGESWEVFSFGNYFAMTIFQNQLVASTTNGTIHFFDLPKKNE